MRASHRAPRPRCTIICQDTDTGAIVRCARWEGHQPPDEHQDYGSVIEQMCEAIVAVRGEDEFAPGGFSSFVVLMDARAWYKKLVRNGGNE